MKQFIVRVITFVKLLLSAMRSNMSHARDMHYIATVYHKPWWWLLTRRRRWIHINLRALWALSDTERAMEFHILARDEDGRWEHIWWDESVYTLFTFIYEEDEGRGYFWVVNTPHGNIPLPWLKGVYLQK